MNLLVGFLIFVSGAVSAPINTTAPLLRRANGPTPQDWAKPINIPPVELTQPLAGLFLHQDKHLTEKMKVDFVEASFVLPELSIREEDLRPNTDYIGAAWICIDCYLYTAWQKWEKQTSMAQIGVFWTLHTNGNNVTTSISYQAFRTWSPGEFTQKIWNRDDGIFLDVGDEIYMSIDMRNKGHDAEGYFENRSRPNTKFHCRLRYTAKPLKQNDAAFMVNKMSADRLFQFQDTWFLYGEAGLGHPKPMPPMELDWTNWGFAKFDNITFKEVGARFEEKKDEGVKPPAELQPTFATWFKLDGSEPQILPKYDREKQTLVLSYT